MERLEAAGRLGRCRSSGPLVGGLTRAHGSGERERPPGLAAVPSESSTVGIQFGWVGEGGGDEETRTPDPLLAKEMLCQLSYVPADRLTTVVGVSGLEPEASALSGQCSNQLS